MQLPFPLSLLLLALISFTNVLSIVDRQNSPNNSNFNTSPLTCYNYSMRGTPKSYTQKEDACPAHIRYCFSVVHKFRNRAGNDENFIQSSVSGCANDETSKLCDEMRNEGKECILGEEAHRRFWNASVENPKIEVKIRSICCLTEDRGNDQAKVFAAVGRHAQSSCYTYVLDPSSSTVDNYKKKYDYCFTNYCKSVIHTVMKNGEMRHYLIGGCADEYEDVVCSKMGTDGCLYGEEALASFAKTLENITIEVHAFCCCVGQKCNSWQKLMDNARLSVCYKYKNVYIGEHDSDTRMKSYTCPSKTCSSMLIHRTDDISTKQMVTGDCAMNKICEDIGTDICMYDGDAAQATLSRKYFRSLEKEGNGAKFKIKAICCCSHDRCNTVDALFGTSANLPRLTTNQCYEYRNTDFKIGAQIALKITKRFGKYCLSRYGSLVDGEATKIWLDANSTEEGVCKEIIGNGISVVDGCLFGEAASNSAHGGAFLARENKNSANKITLSMVCCCKTDKCNSATALLEKYRQGMVTHEPPTTTTSFGMETTNSVVVLCAALLVGGILKFEREM